MISGAAITAAILAAGSPGLRGPDWARVAKAVGTGVASWAKTPSVTLIGVVTGTVGGGTVMSTKFTVFGGSVLVVPAVSAVLQGPEAIRVAKAVGTGVARAINLTAQYRGTATGAIGGEVSKVVLAVPPTLIAILAAKFRAGGIRGLDGTLLATGLGNGISALFMTGVGVGVAVGAPGPAPGIGVSRCKLF